MKFEDLAKNIKPYIAKANFELWQQQIATSIEEDLQIKGEKVYDELLKEAKKCNYDLESEIEKFNSLFEDNDSDDSDNEQDVYDTAQIIALKLITLDELNKVLVPWKFKQINQIREIEQQKTNKTKHQERIKELHKRFIQQTSEKPYSPADHAQRAQNKNVKDELANLQLQASTAKKPFEAIFRKLDQNPLIKFPTPLLESDFTTHFTSKKVTLTLTEVERQKILNNLMKKSIKDVHSEFEHLNSVLDNPMMLKKHIDKFENTSKTYRNPLKLLVEMLYIHKFVLLIKERQQKEQQKETVKDSKKESTEDSFSNLSIKHKTSHLSFTPANKSNGPTNSNPLVDEALNDVITKYMQIKQLLETGSSEQNDNHLNELITRFHNAVDLAELLGAKAEHYKTLLNTTLSNHEIK